MQKNLKATRVTLDELTGYLRQKDVLDIQRVQYAILETGGDLSVFLFPEEQPPSAKDMGVKPQAQSLPMVMVSDGRILRDNLKKAGKDLCWLRKQCKPEKTFLLTVDQDNRVVQIPKQSQRPGK